MMRFPKHKYIRSEKLRRLVASLDCQLCGGNQVIQAAHTNWGAGKGKGIKADDNMIAALCMQQKLLLQFLKRGQRHYNV